MPFDTFSVLLQRVASLSLAHCRRMYGGNALKTEEEIAAAISWRPSFHLKQNNSLILAFEVADNLYPEALKGVATDILHFDFPIAVYQICPLAVFQTDDQQTRTNLLRKHGIGLITVADDDTVTVQISAIPLAQHISNEQLEKAASGLPNSLKVRARSAHQTYLTNAGQGLQQLGQVVEGMVLAMAAQAFKKGVLAAFNPKVALADVIDALYEKKEFKDHRAALGAARVFVRDFRNTASHAPKNAKQAAEKIRNCKKGLLDAIDVMKKLAEVNQKMDYQIRVHTT